jgi:regulator of nonsense transcripts 3
MPGGRRRHDNRQGTIDQDQEFKDFLQGLTNPITKPAAPENEAQKEKVKTTPLIEALREKKANREKPNARGSRQNRGEGKEDNAADKKILSKPGKENALNAGDKNRRLGKADKAQATKEAVKILNKEAASSKSATASTDKASASPAPERKRGNVTLAKSMLQRDLGVGPAPNRRRGTKREVGATSSDVGAPAKETQTSEEKAKDVPAAQPVAASIADKNKKERPTRAERRAFKAGIADKTNNKAPVEDAKPQTPTKAPAPQILKKPHTPVAPKGPAALRAPTDAAAAKNSPGHTQTPSAPAKADSTHASSTSIPTPKALPSSPAPAPTSKQAFLKHANPSQGITEPLIEEVMKTFGGIEKVEIDKRKGFAYVDFAEPEGLQKAMAASPIKIAQGAVQVLERKEKVARTPRFNGPNGPPPTGPARGGRGGFAPRARGGRGGARGGHVVAGPTTNTSDSTSAVPSTAPAAPTPVASTEAGT